MTYDAKWAIGSAADRQTPARCPAQVEPSAAAELGRVALAAFRLAGCRDYARVDMRMDEAGRVYVLEVNGNPDIGPTAGFARSLKAGGIGYEEFVERLVHTAARGGREGDGGKVATEGAEDTEKEQSKDE